MFLKFYDIFYRSFFSLEYFQIIILIIFFISIFLLFLFIILLLLDTLYRPAIDQYPLNFFLNRLCPLIIILSPTLFMYYLDPEIFSFIEKFLILIIIHLLIIIPIMYFWSKHRNWPSMKKNNWKSPSIFLHISISIIYPAIFGILFTILRYWRMGNVIDLSFIFEDKLFLFILILFITIILEYIYVYFLIIFSIINKIRNYFWEECLKVLKGLHIMLLRYNIYFKLMEILYKICFIIFTYIINHPQIYIKTSKSSLRIFLHRLYLNKFPVYVFLFFVFFLEFILNNYKIKYTFYLLFIYIIINLIMYVITTFAQVNWADDCCLADYISYNWFNCKYPQNFWVMFPELYQSFALPLINQKDYDLIENHRKQISKMVKARYRFQTHLLNNYMTKPYNYRLKASYMRWTQVRWTHTRIIHKATSFFARNIWEKVVLINNPPGWSVHFERIEQLEKKIKPNITTIDRNCYVHFEPIPITITKIAQVIEHNLSTNFLPLKENGVTFSMYTKNIQAHISGQAQDDIHMDLEKSKYVFKYILGMDQKAYKDPREGHCKIFSEISNKKYVNLLTSLEQELLINALNFENLDINNISKTLMQMKEHANDISLLQQIWAQNLHYFPKTFIPPLKVANNFCINDIKPEILEKLKTAHFKMSKISDYLFFFLIDENVNYEKAIELFSDSEIQRLMSESL